MNRLKAHSSRVTRGLLLFVAITLTLNSTFGLVAHADAATFLTAKNNKHYAAIYLRDCLAGLGNSKASILQSKAADPASIFVALGKSTPEVNIGQVYKSGDGKLSCSDGGAISTALSTFGTASGEDFLKSIGYTLGSARSIVCKDMNTVPPSNCTDVNVPAYTISGGDTMNSKIPSQSSAARFYAYQNIFNSNCSVTEAASGAYTQTQVIKDPAGSSYITKDVKVDFPSTTSTNPYQSSGSVTISSAGKAIVNLDFNSGDTTCKGLLETMNGLAPAVARYNDANPGNAVTTNASTGAGGNTAVNGSGGTTSTCSSDIGAVGWLVCPIMTFIAGIADGAYAGIKGFLETKPSLVSDKNTVKAWEMFRTIANVMFVIVFLIIVLSQVTSFGISNYGIKKMLPRLIIGAIFVNMSLIICQLAIDLSNILGGSIIALFNSVGAGIGLETNTPQNGFLVFIGWVLAGTGLAVGIVILVLAVSVPVILAAALSLLMTFVILILRNAVILMLVVVAPVAFVAYLLPNTESLFKKWAKMFFALLLVFPVISLLYGAGKLASLILGTSPDWGMQLAALGAAALPLILLPSLLKGSLKATGELGSKLSGLSSKANSNVGKRVDDTKLGQINKHRKQEALARRAKIQGGTYDGKNLLSRGISKMNRGINNSPISGRWGNRQAAQGASVVASQDAEDMKHAAARLDMLADGDIPLTSDELVEIAMGNDVTTSSGQVIKASGLDSNVRRAAMEKVAPIATVDQAHRLINAASTKVGGKNVMGASERKTLSESLAKSSIPTKAPYLGGKTLGDIQAGGVDLNQAALASVRAGKITPEALTGMDPAALRHLVTSAQTTPAGSTERLALIEAYNKIYAPGSQLAGRVTSGTDHETALFGIATL